MKPDWKVVARAIVPAQPGWFLVTPCSDDSLYEVEIIAWRVEHETDGENDLTSTFPITPEDEGQRYALRSPSGHYFIPGHQSFESREELALYWTKS